MDSRVPRAQGCAGAANASYSYDEVGNRVEEIINGVTTGYTYDDNDRLTQTGGASYSHDAQSNTLSQNLAGNTTTYSYNSQQELVSVLTGSGQSLSYQYNTDGIRTGSTECISEVVNCTDPYDYEVLGEVLKQTGLTVNSYLYIGEQYDFCP